MNQRNPTTVITPHEGGRIDLYQRTPQGNIHLVITCCASTGEPGTANESLLLLSDEEAFTLIQSLRLQLALPLDTSPHPAQHTPATSGSPQS